MKGKAFKKFNKIFNYFLNNNIDSHLYCNHLFLKIGLKLCSIAVKMGKDNFFEQYKIIL